MITLNVGAGLVFEDLLNL